MKLITALSTAAVLALSVVPAANAQVIAPAAGGAAGVGVGTGLGLGGLTAAGTVLAIAGATVVVIGVAASEQSSGTN